MIYLLRHGEDDERYIGGWSNAVLTETGVNQIKDAAQFIKKNLNIKTIYSSDIKRAAISAKIVSDALRLRPRYTKQLREQNKGRLTGLLNDMAKEHYPECINDAGIYIRYPEGESLYDLYNRIKMSFNHFIKRDDTLLITHRGVINMIYYLLNNREPDTDKKQFDVTFASIHEIDPTKRLIRKIR